MKSFVVVARRFCFLSLGFYASISPLGALQPVPYETACYPLPCHVSGNGAVFKSLYDSYVRSLCIGNEYLIPKFIHFVWLGSDLPKECADMVATWKKFHPGWIIKIWTDDDIPFFGLQNLEPFNRAKNYGEKADIFRYEILYRYGGLYVDTDFECLQPFDDLHKSCEFYTGTIHNYSPQLLNGMIGAKPGHPIMKACIDNIHVGIGDHDLWRILEETGPHFLTKMLIHYCSTSDSRGIVPFPATFFYPVPNTITDKQDMEQLKREFIRPESMAVHWWSVSWQKNKR